MQPTEEQNLAFMDLHKRTDRFIKEAFQTEEGISEYLRRMEQSANEGRLSVGGWDSDYKKLKHIRWVRNQLAHEVGYDAAIQDPDDFSWLNAFYDRLTNQKDPLAFLEKQREKKAKAVKDPKPDRKKEKKQTEEEELKIMPGVSRKTTRKLTFLESVKRFFGY